MEVECCCLNMSQDLSNNDYSEHTFYCVSVYYTQVYTDLEVVCPSMQLVSWPSEEMVEMSAMKFSGSKMLLQIHYFGKSLICLESFIQ